LLRRRVNPNKNKDATMSEAANVIILAITLAAVGAREKLWRR
jgi:hypothetical protein